MFVLEEAGVVSLNVKDLTVEAEPLMTVGTLFWAFSLLETERTYAD